MTLAILDRTALVHIIGNCPVVNKANVRKAVTPLQCLVYKLAPCGECWPDDVAYRVRIGRPR